MACMGPSYDECVEQGKQALDNALINLECQFGVKRPIVPTGEVKFFANFHKRNQADWDAKVKELQAVLTELCWIDACERF